MAYTQSDLDKIDAAISGQAKNVTLSSGESIEYWTFRELKRRRDHIARQMNKRRPRSFRAYTSKGL